MNISEKIYQLRKDAGISQEKLAEMMGLSRQTISKWEAGTSKPDADALIGLSNLFHISVDSLLRNDTEIMFGQDRELNIQKEVVLEHETSQQETGKKAQSK